MTFEVDNLYTGSANVLGGAVPADTLRLNYKLAELDSSMESLAINEQCRAVGGASDAYVRPLARKRAPEGSIADGRMVFVIRRVS